MKKRKRIRLKRRILEALDLPEESLGDTPKLTLVGDGHMLVENHGGVYEYYGTDVRIDTPLGILHISGEELVLRELSHERLYIGGRICSAAYERGENR